MQPIDDSALLRQYVDDHSDEAFAELVARHVNLVYSVALRQVGNTHSAEEITQAVFIVLAQKAGQLRAARALSSWLFQTTRLTANNFIRSESRRQHREQEAYMQSILNEPGSETWVKIAPLLDTAVADLRERDRQAIVLRFYEGRNFNDIGRALGASEDAAEKRVSRAVEKLRTFFTRRGVMLSTVALSSAMVTHSTQAAPLTLTQAATTAAVAKGATTSGSILTLSKGALKIMAWTKIKTATVIGLGLLIAVGATTVVVKKMSPQPPPKWQQKYDLSVLDTTPPQVKILPSLPVTIDSHLHVMGGHNGKGLGLGQSIPDIIMTAYGVMSAQILWKSAEPSGKYDVIANLPKGNLVALQEEVKKVCGLSIRREMIETNVLLLTVQNPGAPGLHPASGKFSGDQEPRSYTALGQPIFPLVDYMERALHTVILDQTGLKNKYDIDFKWDKTPEGLKKVLRDELGLELEPAQKSIEFLVVEPAR